MFYQKIATLFAAATLLAVGAASPVLAKAHNNGVNMNERDNTVGHISGRLGSSNTYVLTENPGVKNTGTAISGSVSGGAQGQAQSGH